MDLTILKKLGLSDKEIKVYLVLLEYGAISVRGLADIARLNRGTVYDILKKLQEIGLVSYYHQETKQKFVAEGPEKLKELVREKENELKKTKKRILELIPELKSLQDSDGSKPVIKLYEDKNGIKFILTDILNTLSEHKVKEYYVYSAAGVREDVYAAEPNFNRKRIKVGIKVKTISLSPGGGIYGLDARKWIKTSRNQSLNATYMLIYAGKCALISRDSQDKPVGVIIENQMIYETQKIIFQQLWQLLK
jgi:sugar-specific transcriptional regulator TrmB